MSRDPYRGTPIASRLDVIRVQLIFSESAVGHQGELIKDHQSELRSPGRSRSLERVKIVGVEVIRGCLDHEAE